MKPPPAHTNALRRATALALLVAVLVSLTACVSHRLYNESASQYIQQLSIDPNGAVSADLAIVEFDDNGVLWKRDQLEDTIALIRQANRQAQHGTLVIVYIHGWKNNADPENPDGSLARFQETVRRNSAREADGRPFASDRVIGVFLGWRGATSNVPLQEQFTFWDRLRTGERVASVHMQEALLRIMEATKAHPGSKCFIVGHSMGGMIIGNTMSEVLTTLLLSDQGQGVRLPVDLVLLQNPALDALAAWQFIDLLKRFRANLELRSPDGSSTPATGPLIAAITSEADAATGRAYPFGRGLASFGVSFRSDHAPDEPSQRYLATHALGHTDYLISHRAFVRDGQVVMEPVPDAFNTTPFWVIQVSKEISRDHGDVNNAVYGQLIEQIIQLNEIYRTDLETWISVTGDR